MENLRGKGFTSMMEVRELGGNGKFAIMHTSNSAIICYGDGTKEDAERILTLLTAAGELLDALKAAKDELTFIVVNNDPTGLFAQLGQKAFGIINEALAKAEATK